jgi:putative ATP-binding cassette transporter
MNFDVDESRVNDAVNGSFFSRVWKLVTPYWRSEEKGMAWVLLIAVIVLSLFSVFISVLVNSWYRDFYNALQNKDLGAFTHLILYFCGIAAIAILGAVYRLYLTQMLTIRWRRWLTEQHFAKWLAHKNYYRLEQGGYTDNPDQRLSEDLNNFTSDTLSLSLGLLRTVVSLVSFSVILWGVSGSIELFGITIPGYMFWAALIYAAVGSLLTHLIGKRLILLSNQQQRYEADMRFSLVRVRENAESIALSDGEANENQEGAEAPDVLHRRLLADRNRLCFRRGCTTLLRRQNRTGRADADQLGVRQCAGKFQLVHRRVHPTGVVARHL